MCKRNSRTRTSPQGRQREVPNIEPRGGPQSIPYAPQQGRKWPNLINKVSSYAFNKLCVLYLKKVHIIHLGSKKEIIDC